MSESGSDPTIKIIVLLVGLLVIAGTFIIYGTEMETGFADSIEGIINTILDALFRSLDDAQIAKDSTQALACAVDVVAKYSDGTPIPEGVEMFDGVCQGIYIDNEVTAMAIGNGITGMASSVDGKCGPMEKECGRIFKDSCDSGEMCKCDIFGCSCEQDNSCLTATEQAVEFGGATMCFGENNHVCVICGNTAQTEGTTCCDCKLSGPPMSHFPSLVAGSDCGIASGVTYTCTATDDSYCSELNESEINYGYGTTETDQNKMNCKVIGFELPQDNVMNDKEVFSDLTDYALKWVGAIGQPKYLVYFETFPEYAEAPWMYKDNDVYLHAFAIGAVANIGIGGLKVAGSSIKNGQKYIFASLVKNAENEAKKKLYSANIKRALVREFGGKQAEKLFISSLLAHDIIGDQANDAFYKQTQKSIYDKIAASENEELWTKFFGRNIDDIGGGSADDIASKLRTSDEWVNQANQMSDLTGYSIGSREYITEDQMRDIISKNSKAETLSKEEIKKLVDETNSWKTMMTKNEFIDKAGRQELVKSLLKDENKIYKEFFEDIEKTTTKAFQKQSGNKLGMYGAIKIIKNKIFKGSTVDEAVEKEIDEVAKLTYSRWMWEMANAGGDLNDVQKIGTMVLADDYLTKGGAKIPLAEVVKDGEGELADKPGQLMLNAYIANWNNLPIDTTVRLEILQRSKQALKGMTGMPYEGNIGKARVAVMSTAIATAYVSMQTEEMAEKYKICGDDAMCLNWPGTWFHIGNNPTSNSYEGYETKNLNDMWVELNIPEVTGSKGFEVALASPCKANIDVWADTCECKEMLTNQEIGVIISPKIRYESIDAEGNIDNDHDYTELVASGANDERTVILPCNARPDENACDRYKLQPYNGAIDDYIGNAGPESQLVKDVKTLILSLDPGFTEHYDPNHSWDEKDKKQFVLWDCPGYTLGSSITQPFVNEFEDQVMCYSYYSADYTFLNLRVQEKTDVFGNVVSQTASPYKRCTKYRIWDIVDELLDEESKCIKLEVDAESMKMYRSNGYDPNFCRDNRNEWKDKASVAVDAGLFVGGVALALWPPTSPMGSAYILGVTGFAGGAGEVAKTYWDISETWPVDQSG